MPRLVWLQTRTSLPSKDWPDACWLEAMAALREDGCAFIDMEERRFTPRMAALITRYCDAGIALDSFGLHAAAAAGAPGVVAIMVESHASVVCHPGQHPLGTPGVPVSPREVVHAVREALVL